MRCSGELKIIAGSALFSFIPVCVVYGNELSVQGLLFGRLSVAGIILFVLQKNRLSLFKLSGKDLSILLGWSLLMLGAMACYFMAINYSSMAVSSALLGTQPLVIVLLAALFLKEKISMTNLVAGFAALCGIVCITGLSGITDRRYFTGELLALLSSVLLGFNFMIQKRYLKAYNGYQLVFYQSIFQLPFLLPFLFFHPGQITVHSFSAVLLLGIVCTVLSYSLIYNGARQVKGQKIGILQSIEYVMPVLIAIVFYHESPGFPVLIGMALLLSTCLITGSGVGELTSGLEINKFDRDNIHLPEKKGQMNIE